MGEGGRGVESGWKSEMFSYKDQGSDNDLNKCRIYCKPPLMSSVNWI